MVDNYCRLPVLKGHIGQASASINDSYLLLIDAVSRQVDIDAQRHFYSQVGTRYFGGNLTHELLLFDGALFHDLLSVTSITVDVDGDGTYEITLAANTDYWLEPGNVRPNEPYTSIRLNPNGTQLGGWPRGRRAVKVIGTWGYSNETENTYGVVGADAINASATSLPIKLTGTPAPDDDAFAAGDVLVIGSEQVQLLRHGAVASGTASWTVERGHNGTTAASHDADVAIYRRRYDRQIELAVIEQCSRLIREIGTGNSGGVGNGEFGFSFSALYPDIRERIERRRRGLGVA